MTRSNGYNQFINREAPGVVAAVHRQGGEWRVIILDRTGASFSVKDARSVPLESASGLNTLLADSEADLIIRVLPGGSVVCRTITLPEMEEAVLAAALDLQAEGALPSGLDPHRRASAIVPWVGAAAERVGVAVGWPGRIPERVELDSRTRFAPEAACLIELLAIGGGEGFACFVDPGNKSIEFVAHEGATTIIRTARLSEQDAALEANRIITETALAAGYSGAALDDLRRQITGVGAGAGPALVMNDEVQRRLARLVRGASSDSGWWSKYGVALGAAIAAGGPRRALVELYAEPPTGPENRALRALAWVAEPKRAMKLAGIAIMLMLVSPPLFAWMRYAWLNWKARDLPEVRAAHELITEQQEFYQILRDERWPMTKLLADISLATPHNVQIDVANLVQSQGSIVIRGSAPAESMLSDELGPFGFYGNLQNLQRAGIFREVVLEAVNPEADRATFDIRITVGEPYLMTDYANVVPRRVELYGEEARDMPFDGYVLGSAQPAARFASGRSRPGGTDRSSARAGGADDGGDVDIGESAVGETEEPTNISAQAQGESRASRPRLDPGELPPPLTPEQIQSMTRDEVQSALVQVGRMKWTASGDEKYRLEREYAMLARRRVELIPDAGEDD